MASRTLGKALAATSSAGGPGIACQGETIREALWFWIIDQHTNFRCSALQWIGSREYLVKSPGLLIAGVAGGWACCYLSNLTNSDWGLSVSVMCPSLLTSIMKCLKPLSDHRIISVILFLPASTIHTLYRKKTIMKASPICIFFLQIMTSWS